VKAFWFVQKAFFCAFERILAIQPVSVSVLKLTSRCAD
jgi:hypothetical protein